MMRSRGIRGGRTHGSLAVVAGHPLRRRHAAHGPRRAEARRRRWRPGLQGWTANVERMGFRPAALWAAASVAAEFIGGIALAVGFLTPLVAASLVGQLFVAIAK